MKQYLLYAIDSGVARRSFIVALIVGAVLNIINQGDAILAGDGLHWGKAALTFAVLRGSIWRRFVPDSIGKAEQRSVTRLRA